MLEIADELRQWCLEGRDFAIAIVASVHGSAPRQPGAALAVDSDGTAIGSVSGGCLESAAYDLCREAIFSGESMLRGFSYSDEDAFAVGLTCGGDIELFVTPMLAGSPSREILESMLAVASAGGEAAGVWLTDGPAELVGTALLVHPDGSYEGADSGCSDLMSAIVGEALALLETGRTGTLLIDEPRREFNGSVTAFIQSVVPPARMIIFGAIDFSADLARMGKLLGYRVTVCDARPTFATWARFPDAHEVVADWPHRYLGTTPVDMRTVLCVLTHDAKFDVPLLEKALRLPVAYVGAMGSRRTHQQRLELLREEGLTEQELAKLHSPIGLDLRGESSAETAISIVAEIVASRRGGSGRPLTATRGSIHEIEANRTEIVLKEQSQWRTKCHSSSMENE
ncbi:XdhC/CoxI family protein [Streptomyces sp. NPDC007861]|uniref:XdhC/CoxI family protein n=1 Tax=Streptomyces sp. NPDC007861 TaxID=3154893 RepID=UPI0033EA4F8C